MDKAIGDIIGISAGLIVGDVGRDNGGLEAGDIDKHVVRITVELTVGDMDDIGPTVGDTVGDTVGLCLRLRDGDTIGDVLVLVVG